MICHLFPVKFLLLLFTLLMPLAADEGEYLTLTDLPYYPDEADQTDYQKERCKLDLIYPHNSKNFATVVWFHGGGLTGGSKHFPKELLHQGIAVVSVDYRLAPMVKAPAYLEDAAASVAWVFKNIAKYGGSPDLIFLSGHSAGGYLASMVGLDKSYLEAFDSDANDLAGLVPFSGHTITHFAIRKERGIPDTRPIIDKFAPLFHVRADAPPLLLITGDRELEMLGRYEENAYLYRMMKVAGAKDVTIMELDGYGHDIVAPACPLLVRFVERITKRLVEE